MAASDVSDRIKAARGSVGRWWNCRSWGFGSEYLPAEAENLPAVDVAREGAFAYLADGARGVTRFRAGDLDQDDWSAHMWGGGAKEQNGADVPVVDQVDPA